MQHHWKCLASEVDAPVSSAKLAVAESAYLAQRVVVANLMKSHQRTVDARVFKNKSTFWSAVSGKVKQSTEITSVQDSEGSLKCEPNEIIREVENHFVRVFDGSVNPVPPPASDLIESEKFIPSTYGDHTYAVSPMPMLLEYDDSDSIDSNPNRWLGRRFTANEVKSTAKSLLNNKACGWDSIPNEFIKNAPHQLFLLLSLLFNQMRDSNHVYQ